MNRPWWCVALAVVAVCSAIPTTAHAGTLDNPSYYQLRDKLRNTNLTELQKRRVCDQLTGNQVRFFSWVADVRANGSVIADMDDAVLSLPEITVQDIDEDAASRLRRNQLIRYTGTISGCEFDGITLSLTISGSSLN